MNYYHMTTQEITKVQELIYTTRVEQVMAANVVVLQSSMSMAEAKAFMRNKRISGAPVVQGESLVGIITMTDVIRAMEMGKLNAPVSELMTREVRTAFNDASVVEVVKSLGREGFARLPVVDGMGDL